jgi:hypothetical protein
MPGVERYEYFTKAETLRRLLDGRLEANPPMSTMAASCALRVKNVAQANGVAQQFFNDPAVNNDAGTHDGVVWWKVP